MVLAWVGRSSGASGFQPGIVAFQCIRVKRWSPFILRYLPVKCVWGWVRVHCKKGGKIGILLTLLFLSKSLTIEFKLRRVRSLILQSRRRLLRRRWKRSAGRLARVDWMATANGASKPWPLLLIDEGVESFLRFGRRASGINLWIDINIVAWLCRCNLVM